MIRMTNHVGDGIRRAAAQMRRFRKAECGMATVVYVGGGISRRDETRKALEKNARRQWRPGLQIGNGRIVTWANTDNWPTVFFSWAKTCCTVFGGQGDKP